MRSERRRRRKGIRAGYLGLLCGGLTIAMPGTADETKPAQEPVDVLEPGPGADLVAAHCGACHSLRLVTQNRGDAAHWRKLIRWMQAEHNLWDLGGAEADILDYLSRHYGAPTVSPRRAPLEIHWRSAPD